MYCLSVECCLLLVNNHFDQNIFVVAREMSKFIHNCTLCTYIQSSDMISQRLHGLSNPKTVFSRTLTRKPDVGRSSRLALPPVSNNKLTTSRTPIFGNAHQTISNLRHFSTEPPVISTAVMEGHTLADNILDEVYARAANLRRRIGRAPKLCVVLVGTRADSQKYIRVKQKAAKCVGIDSALEILDENISMPGLLGVLHKLNADPSVDGIIIQLPLPAHLNASAALQSVAPHKDVDGFHLNNQAHLLDAEHVNTQAFTHTFPGVDNCPAHHNGHRPTLPGYDFPTGPGSDGTTVPPNRDRSKTFTEQVTTTTTDETPGTTITTTITTTTTTTVVTHAPPSDHTHTHAHTHTDTQPQSTPSEPASTLPAPIKGRLSPLPPTALALREAEKLKPTWLPSLDPSFFSSVWSYLSFSSLNFNFDLAAITSVLLPAPQEKQLPGATTDSDGEAPCPVPTPSHPNQPVTAPTLFPCTPLSCIALLDHYKVPLCGAHVVVLGRSTVVGFPLSLMLMHRGAVVSNLDKHATPELRASLCRQADVIVTAVGKAGFITRDCVRPGAVVIDVGINFVRVAEESDYYPSPAVPLRRWNVVDGPVKEKQRKDSIVDVSAPADASASSQAAAQPVTADAQPATDVAAAPAPKKPTMRLVGDADFHSLVDHASMVTPVPGGVGPVTVAMLLRNTVLACEYNCRHMPSVEDDGR